MKHIIVAIVVAKFSFNVYSQTITNPRTPAEFEEVKGILICWDEQQYLSIFGQVEEHGSWTLPKREQYEGLMNTQATILHEVLNEGIEAYVIDDTSHNPAWFGKLYSEYKVADTLTALGIQSPNLHIILSNGQPPHSVWSRDWGPLTVYKNRNDTAYTVGWQYNNLIANYLQRPFVPSPDLMDGGNFLTDGHGRIFLSSLQPNIDLTLFGITDSIHTAEYKVHIDYWMKMINEETFFINEIPSSNYLPPLDYFFADDSVLDAAITRIKQRSSCYGRPYKFVKIRTAPTYNHNNLTYLTSNTGYVNSLIMNKTVLVPLYDNLETDTLALNTYKKYMPGYRIVGISAKHFAGMEGAIHCITKEIPADEPVFISHAWLADTLTTALPSYEIKASINTKSGIDHAEVFWTTNPNDGFQSISMNKTVADTFVAYIPGQAGRTRTLYYISATAHGGKTWTKPSVAPNGYFSFVVLGATGIAQDVSSLPRDFALSQNFPNPFNPNTTIRFELPRESFVTLNVYNVLGQEVVTLVHENRAAGRYNIKFDGSQLTSGMYFYRLHAGEYVKTEKSVLLR